MNFRSKSDWIDFIDQIQAKEKSNIPILGVSFWSVLLLLGSSGVFIYSKLPVITPPTSHENHFMFIYYCVMFSIAVVFFVILFLEGIKYSMRRLIQVAL